MPECLWSATFYPEPEAAAYVAGAGRRGVEVFKVHVQVGGFHLDDPLLDDACGSGSRTRDADRGARRVGAGAQPSSPGPRRCAGAARWPRLAVVVAHLGAPEYDEFLSLAERFERVHLDTTMVFTDFFERAGAVPPRAAAAAADLRDKVLLGSDFPTIPYPYLHQLESLERLGLGEEWLRARVLGQRCADADSE